MTPFALSTLGSVNQMVAALIGYAGVIVILFGSAKGAFLFLRRFRRNGTLLADIRMEVGQHLALGLEFLVGKDIVSSIVEPTWDDLGKLAVIILLRTLLTLFLGFELKGVKEEAAEEQEIQDRVTTMENGAGRK